MRRNGIDIIDPERDPRWDEFVARHPSGWIYHSSGWKRVLERSFPQMKGFCLVKSAGPGSTIEAGLPLFLVSSAITGTRLVSTPFGTLSTPLFEDDRDWPIFLETALVLAKKFRCSYISIQSLRAMPSSGTFPFSETSPYRHHSICLTKDPQALFKTFDRSCVRQRISRAQASGLSVRTGTSEEDLRSFFNLFIKTRRRVCRPTQPYRFLRMVWEEFQPSGRCFLLLVDKDNVDIAGLLLFCYKERVSAEWAASDDAFKNFSPNPFVFWEAIKKAQAGGFQIFDFGRTSPFNKGLMDFKNRWGTTVSEIYEVRHPASKGTTAESEGESFLKRFMSKTCSLTPEYLQEALGRFIYRHLG